MMNINFLKMQYSSSPLIRLPLLEIALSPQETFLKVLVRTLPQWTQGVFAILWEFGCRFLERAGAVVDIPAPEYH